MRNQLNTLRNTWLLYSVEQYMYVDGDLSYVTVIVSRIAFLFDAPA